MYSSRILSSMFHAEKSVSNISQLDCSKDSSQKTDSYGVDAQVSGIGFFDAQDEIGFSTSPDHLCIVVSPPFQSCLDEIEEMTSVKTKATKLVEPRKRQSYAFSTEPFEVLRKYGRRRLRQDASPSTSQEMQCDQTSSTETTIRVAAEHFIQSIRDPYLSYLLPHSGEDSQGVQLIQNLLFCAEKVADNQYERAIKFLKECDSKSLASGTPIQRLAFYFCQALFEKIANETGRVVVKDLDKQHADPVDSVMFPNMNLLISFHQEHPLAQVTKLVGIQAILDHVQMAEKVHMIDLQIRSGVQWIILMQDVAARTEPPICHLKITAVGTNKEKSRMEETGRQLARFADSVSLDFTFEIVTVDDFSDLNHALFDLNGYDSVAFYAPYILGGTVGRINQLDHLMKMMKSMSPCVVIVTELEVNCNSPTFIERFVESLFFFGAFFDSLEDCFKNDEMSRSRAESCWFGSAIRNILAADGNERKLRHVNINVWRAFFARFGLVETELSTSSLNQATMGLQSLPYGKSCTLYRDGKCLTIGWKGTPLSFVSAWKFQ